MGMANHEGAEAHGKVRVLLPISVVHLGTLGSLDVDRVWLVRAEIARDPQGQHFLGPEVELVALRRLSAIALEFLSVSRHLKPPPTRPTGLKKTRTPGLERRSASGVVPRRGSVRVEEHRHDLGSR